jgi:hypothetical protein
MPVPISRPTGGKPWGPLQDAVDWLNRVQGLTDRPDKMWQPGVRNLPTNYKQAELAAGQAAANFRAGAGFPGQRPTPIVRGTRDGVTPDRTQSDLYKQYALNPQGQFDRYFGSSEMDPYFGAASRGAGAPKDLAAMQALAGQTKAPTDTPLASYYRSQSAAGRGNMEEIISAMGYQGPMAEWARANPMLAQREYAKSGKASAPAENIAEFGARAQEQGGYVETMLNRPGLFGGTPGTQQIDAGTNFSAAVNTVPGPWDVQGAMVDLNRGAPALFAAQAEKTNPMNASSQEIPVGDRTREFLQKIAK